MTMYEVTIQNATGSAGGGELVEADSPEEAASKVDVPEGYSIVSVEAF